MPTRERSELVHNYYDVEGVPRFHKRGYNFTRLKFSQISENSTTKQYTKGILIFQEELNIGNDNILILETELKRAL